MTRQRGWTIWLTGLPASGKTTLARVLQAVLLQHGLPVVVLDSDLLRPVLAPEAGFADADRAAFYARLVELAALLNADSVNVLIAATANRRAFRQQARQRLQLFAEVWVRCALDVCRARDPKGLYRRAQAGLIQHLPGVDEPYESPVAPEVIVDTDRQTPEQAAHAMLAGVPWLRHLAGAHP